MRTGRGHNVPPPIFRKCFKNDGEQRHQAWDICAQIKNTPCVKMLTSQVKRSGHQVRSKSDVHSGTGFKLQDRAVSTGLSPHVFKPLG